MAVILSKNKDNQAQQNELSIIFYISFWHDIWCKKIKHFSIFTTHLLSQNWHLQLFLELQNYALLLDSNRKYHSTLFFDTSSDEIHDNFDDASQVCFFDEFMKNMCIDIPLGLLLVIQKVLKIAEPACLKTDCEYLNKLSQN